MLESIRFKAVTEQRSVKCNISNQKLLEILNDWFKKQHQQKYTTTGVGTLGFLNKKKASFRIFYRYMKPVVYDPFVYSLYYIIGSIYENSNGSCTVRYKMVYDRLQITVLRIFEVALFTIGFVLLFKPKIILPIIDDSVTFIFSILFGVICLLGGLILFLYKGEKKDDVIHITEIFENFL